MQEQDFVALFKRAAFEVESRRFETIEMDAPLAKLELNSVAVMEIIGFVEDELKLRFADEDLARVTTLRDLLNLVQRARSAA